MRSLRCVGSCSSDRTKDDPLRMRGPSPLSLRTVWLFRLRFSFILSRLRIDQFRTGSSV